MNVALRDRLVLAGILMVTVWLGARGITDEEAVMLGGDMARYVMNGVFFHDLVASGHVWNVNDLMNYAERYYAKYPALSLGHHPPLLSIVMVPMFAVLGITLLAARLVALGFFVLAVWALHSLAKRLFGWQAALWATGLFVTNLMVLRSGQYALSEMPMVALVLVSFNALFRYCDSGLRKHLAWFVIAVAASMYAKQLAFFLLPAYAVVLVSRMGWRRLFHRDVVIATLAGAVLIAPVALMSFAFSPSNVRVAVFNVTHLGSQKRGASIMEILATIINSHLSIPALVAVAGGTLVLAVKRNPTLMLVWTWILSVWAGAVVFGGTTEPARYAFGAMPAYCLVASGLIVGQERRRVAQWVGMLVLCCALLWQGWMIRNVRPSGARGYEAAAEYVLSRNSAPVVLLDTVVDTGYFVFFVRKHDPSGRHVVLRVDQFMRRGSTINFDGPANVDSALKKFGVKFIVTEDIGIDNRRQFLRDHLKAGRFVERLRVPIQTTHDAARGADLVVYEYQDAQPADLSTHITLRLGLARRQLELTLGDLIGEPGR